MAESRGNRFSRNRTKQVVSYPVETAVLQVESAAHLGQGLARIDGKVILMPFVAVGDVVEVSIVSDHGFWARALMKRLIQAGSGRVEPRCPVYGQCGGCHLQHIDDEARRLWKIQALRDVLTRIGRVEPPDIEFVTGPAWNWRCRMTLHVKDDGAGPDAGFFAQGSHTLVPPGKCPAAMEPVRNLLEPVRRAVRRECGIAGAEIEPVCGSDGRCVVVASGERGNLTGLHRTLMKIDGVDGVHSRSGGNGWKSEGDATIKWPTAGKEGEIETLDIDPRGFTQAHLQMNPVLVETVISHLGRAPDQMNILELYAGAGNITVPLAMRGAHVLASDINHKAVENGAAQCMMRSLDVQHISGKTDTVLGRLPADFKRPDAVVADPPRTGLGAAASTIAAIGCPRVVICSCEPSTMARDIGPFLKAGYRIDRVSLIDMFPTTYHMETVISLTFNQFCGESPSR